MTELCARFQVSRRVSYKWVARYDADGVSCERGHAIAGVVARRQSLRTGSLVSQRLVPAPFRER